MQIAIRNLAESRLGPPELISPDLLMKGMAHDLNNMLAVIASGLSILERGNPDARQPAVMGGMRRALFNASTLVSDIVTLTAGRDHPPEPVSAATLLGDLQALIERELPGNVRYEIEIEDGIWPIRVIRPYFEFALLNLVINSLDAMPQGGQLKIRASNIPQESSGSRAGDFIRIDVKDTGAGIPEDIRDRVFEPFFTTKAGVGGSGLGLGNVRRFTDQHGGHVAIDSNVGEGTMVVMLLPRSV